MIFLFMMNLLGDGSASLKSSLESLAKQYMQERSIPGLAICVIRNGDLIYQTHGLADISKNIPVTESTVFDLGSIKKHVTAAAILRLQEEQKLHISDSFFRWYKDRPVDPSVTLRHMLNQMSGLPDDASDPLSLAFHPGERWAYRNANFDLLDEVIQRASGQSFPNFIEAHFFHPLGLPSLKKCDGTMAKTRHATGYHLTNGTLEAVQSDECWFVGTANDLAKWVRALVNSEVISQKSLEMALKPAVLNDGTAIPYGFGLDLTPYRSQKRISHTGHSGGFTSAFAHYPEHDLTITVLGNSDGLFDPESIEMAIARTILNLENYSSKKWTEANHNLENFCGIYDTGPIWFVTTHQDDRLWLHMMGPEKAWQYVKLEMVQVGPNQFEAMKAPEAIHLEFFKSESGIYNRANIRMVGALWPSNRRN